MRRDDRGTLTTELVLITPVVLILMQFLVFTGRFGDARSDVVSAARDAARAASIQRNGFDARAMADQTADATLAGEGIRCEDGGPTVAVSFSGSHGVGFQPGNFVHVAVTCKVRLADLFWLNMPGALERTYEAAEVIDVFRGPG